MDYAAALQLAADELFEGQAYDTSSGSLLYRVALRAAREINNKYPWPHRFATTTITTTSGNLGPYDLPSDFYKFAQEERLSKPERYDKFSVAVVPDDDYQITIGVYYQRVEKKLYYDLDPGDDTRNFTYIKKLDALTDLEDWPEELQSPWIEFIKGYIKANSQDTRQESIADKQEAMRLLKDVWTDTRSGDTLQAVRTPRTVRNDAFYEDYWD